MLSKVFSRADSRGVPLSGEFEKALIQSLGIDNAGVAACRATALAIPETGYNYLCADPVHLIPNRDQLVLDHPAGLQLSEAETAQLINELSSHFETDGHRFHKLSTNKWVLATTENPDINTCSPEHVIGRNVIDYLPKGNHALQWHAWLTEAQSLLHMSSVNEYRDENGLAPVNSIWLWGEGNAPDLAAMNWSNIYADDVLVQGLADAAGIKHAPAEDIDWNNSEQSTFILITPATVKSLTGALTSYEQYCDAVYTYWIKEAIKQLGSGKISEIRLLTQSASPFVLRRSMLYRWWRKNKPILSSECLDE